MHHPQSDPKWRYNTPTLRRQNAKSDTLSVSLTVILVQGLKPLKTAFLLYNIYKFSSYLTGNTLRHRYKAQPVNAVWGNSRCLLWEPYGTHKYTVWAECRVRTRQETHHVSATKPNRLMLFGEAVAVYCENHTEHTDTLCGQSAEF
jgi:hypothetical protein